MFVVLGGDLAYENGRSPGTFYQFLSLYSRGLRHENRLIPLLACVIISMMGILPGIAMPYDKLWYVVAYRGLLSAVPGAWLPVTGQSMISDMDRPEQLFANMDLFSNWKAFTLPDLWIGAVVGIAFIAAAIWMRRSRELAD